MIEDVEQFIKYYNMSITIVNNRYIANAVLYIDDKPVAWDFEAKIDEYEKLSDFKYVACTKINEYHLKHNAIPINSVNIRKNDACVAKRLYTTSTDIPMKLILKIIKKKIIKWIKGEKHA